MTKCPIAHALDQCQLALGRVQQRQPQAGYTFTAVYESMAAARAELARRIPLSDAQIDAAARVLNDRAAVACGIDKDDQWKIYSEDFKGDARAMLRVTHGDTQVTGE